MFGPHIAHWLLSSDYFWLFLSDLHWFISPDPNNIEYMRGKKRYSDKDIIVQEVYVKKTSFGEETAKGKVVSVITVLGEELPVDEYEFK